MDDTGKEAHEAGSGTSWPTLMSWAGRISALIALFGSLAGGVTWIVNHHKQEAEREAQMKLADAQAAQNEYQASLETYEQILNTDPLYRPAKDQQLNTAMLWVEDFHGVAQEDSGRTVAGDLGEILKILDSALTRTSGTQKADVLAHIGWAHWLNQKIAMKEFGPMAEQNLREALNTDPSNVYANAMLGNWMLQNHGSFTEAIQHLKVAVATGKSRIFVRRFQLGGLIGLEQKGARAELVKAANDIRRSNEPIDNEEKARILSFCFDTLITDHGELVESLSAVPPDDAWATYLWLNDDRDQDHEVVQAFIDANLQEVAGRRDAALQKFHALKQELIDRPGSMSVAVDASIARLTK